MGTTHPLRATYPATPAACKSLSTSDLARRAAAPPKSLIVSNLRVKHNLTKKNKKKVVFSVDFSDSCDILFSVMRDMFKKNHMTLKEIERYIAAKRKREAKLRETTKKNKING